MTRDSVGYEIRKGAAPDGGLLLELVIEGATLARAGANAAMLVDLDATLGLSRDAVAERLSDALREALRSQGQYVELTDIVEDAGRPLRFKGRFTHRLRDEIATGLVWYDVRSSTTGPEELPAVVRNKMRFEVHRKLTGEGSAARALVDLHK